MLTRVKAPVARGAMLADRDQINVAQAGSQASRRASARAKHVAITMWDLAIWTYQAQKAHRDYGRVGGVFYSSRSQTAVLGEICAAGGQFGSGGGSARTYADDDALTVHEMVLRMTGEERALIITTAKTASAPDWSPCIPAYKIAPVPGRKGRLYKGIYDRSGNEVGCEIEYHGFAPARAVEVVRHARDVYDRWWRALWVLREGLMACGELRRWAVTGVGVEREPWAQSQAVDK